MLLACIAIGRPVTAGDSPVFVSVSDSPIRLETFIYQPEGPGRFPVVIFNHGSSRGKPHKSYPSRRLAEYFVKRGFIFIAPMRRGRGQSSGVSAESEDRNCDPQSWIPGLELAADDVSAVFEYVGSLPNADSSTVILAGASRGGFLSVAYAADGKYRKRVVGVINFVGGWVAQAQHKCDVDFNYISYAKFGARTRAPMLWLYGSPDEYYATRSIRSYQRVFASEGGNVRFRLIHGVPGNGHRLPVYEHLWARPVGFFLDSLRAQEAHTDAMPVASMSLVP
jgi:dienelactone hydrolase